MSSHNLDTLLLQLLKREHFLTASQMVAALSAGGQPFNKTSVYRSLDRLLANGQVCEHYFHVSQGLVYELRGNHHDHVACENCGEVWTSECQDNGSLEGYAAKPGQSAQKATSPLPPGFAQTHHHLTIFGLCERCQHNSTRTAKRPAAQ